MEKIFPLKPIGIDFELPITVEEKTIRYYINAKRRGESIQVEQGEKGMVYTFPDGSFALVPNSNKQGSWWTLTVHADKSMTYYDQDSCIEVGPEEWEEEGSTVMAMVEYTLNGDTF